MQKGVTKEMYYTQLICRQIVEMLTDEECENYIDQEELKEGDNGARFIHALIRP
jgi:hypothetical protein